MAISRAVAGPGQHGAAFQPALKADMLSVSAACSLLPRFACTARHRRRSVPSRCSRRWRRGPPTSATQGYS